MRPYKYIIIIFLFSSFTMPWKRDLKFDAKYIGNLRNSPLGVVNKVVFCYKIKNYFIINILNPVDWTWENNEDGFCEILVVNGAKTFKLENFTIWEDWDKKFKNYSEIKNRHFLYLNLGDGKYVIALKGSMSSSHNQGCPILTLILVNEEEPKVIFNTHVKLLKIIKNDDNTCKLRVRFGKYEYELNAKKNEQGRSIPCNFDDVYVCDLYVRNNELVVEKLSYTRQEVYDTFTDEEIEASYN